MKKFLGYAEPISGVLASAFFLWMGIWLPAKLAGSEPPSPFVVIFKNLLSFETPVPYIAGILCLGVWGTFNGRRIRVELDELRAKKDRLPKLEDELRKEKQAHAESKSSYSESLKSALQFMLCSEATGFDHQCRVSIYRRQTSVDDKMRLIFRFSEHHSYKVDGRLTLPMDEGVVGAAWKNHGVKHVTCEHPPDSQEFRDHMKTELGNENCALPAGQRSMPTKEFYAKALQDHDTGNRIAVVVFEATEVGRLNIATIDSILANQTLDVTRFVKHLGRLDLEFAPKSGRL